MECWFTCAAERGHARVPLGGGPPAAAPPGPLEAAHPRPQQAARTAPVRCVTGELLPALILAQGLRCASKVPDLSTRGTAYGGGGLALGSGGSEGRESSTWVQDSEVEWS